MAGQVRHAAASCPTNHRHGDVASSRPAHRALAVTAAVLGLLLVGAAASAGLVARHLQGNITAVDISTRLGEDRPEVSAVRANPTGTPLAPLNVLVMGSDSRQGDNGFIGGTADEGRSDTTLLLHLSADRTAAVAVSIPRDSMVAMPDCTDRDGKRYPGALRQFNDAYTIGGAACTVRTVEQLTRVRVDHYAVIDFAGFAAMVDALGSVEICLPEAVDDRRHHIRLPAGRTRVNGVQALAYVRERYALGDGSDLSRIGRQQAFLSSVLQEAGSAGTLGNPVRLYAFLDAATKSVTTDPALAGLPRLVELTRQVRAIGLDRIQFLTVPTGAYPSDPNRLLWTPAAADLWRAIRADRPIVVTGAAGAKDRADSAGDARDGSGAADRAGVRVRVLNGSGRAGLGARASDQLTAAGFTVVGGGTATGTAKGPAAGETHLRYGPGEGAHARTLAAGLPFAQLIPDRSLGRTIVVVVGRDWTPPRPPEGPAPGPAPTASRQAVAVAGAQNRTAEADICTG